MAKAKEQKQSRIKTSKPEIIKKIAFAISNMREKDVVAVSSFARSLKMHPETLTDTLDMFDVLRNIGFLVLRDPQGKIKTLMKTNEENIVKSDIRQIKRDLIDIKGKLENIETSLNLK